MLVALFLFLFVAITESSASSVASPFLDVLLSEIMKSGKQTISRCSCFSSDEAKTQMRVDVKLPNW